MHPVIEFFAQRDGDAAARQSVKPLFEAAVRAVVAAAHDVVEPACRAHYLDDAQAYAAYLGDGPALALLNKLQAEVLHTRMGNDALRAQFSDQFLRAHGATAAEWLEHLRSYPLDPARAERLRAAQAQRSLSEAVDFLEAHGLDVADLG